MNISEIDCLVLAGGRGTRIQHLLPPDTPKFLAPINGRPFADYLLSYLQKQGIKRVVLALSYQREKIISYLDFLPYRSDFQLKMNIHWDWTPEPLGIEKSIQHALKGRYKDNAKGLLKTDPILIVNGDTLTDIDLQRCLTIKYSLEYTASAEITEIWCNNIISSRIESSGVVFKRQTTPLKMFIPLKMFNDLDTQTYFFHHYLDIGTPEGFTFAQNTDNIARFIHNINPHHLG